MGGSLEFGRDWMRRRRSQLEVRVVLSRIVGGTMVWRGREATMIWRLWSLRREEISEEGVQGGERVRR